MAQLLCNHQALFNMLDPLFITGTGGELVDSLLNMGNLIVGIEVVKMVKGDTRDGKQQG